MNLIGWQSAKNTETEQSFLSALGGTTCSYQCIKRGCRVGYETVRMLYNIVGEEELIKIMDFEEESWNRFKSKYVQVNKHLY